MRETRLIYFLAACVIGGCATSNEAPPEASASAERAYTVAQAMVRARLAAPAARFPAFGADRRFSRGNDHTSIESDSIQVMIQPSKSGANLITLDSYVQTTGAPAAFTARLTQQGDSIGPLTGSLEDDVDLPE
jgi:hypothetical protein